MASLAWSEEEGREALSRRSLSSLLIQSVLVYRYTGTKYSYFEQYFVVVRVEDYRPGREGSLFWGSQNRRAYQLSRFVSFHTIRDLPANLSSFFKTRFKKRSIDIFIRDIRYT
jgi:hypothetical protein